MKLLDHPYFAPFALLGLCLLGLLLSACATYTVRVPLGANEAYGAAEIGLTYYPPQEKINLWHVDAPPTLTYK
jgi:hypothetical protein